MVRKSIMKKTFFVTTIFSLMVLTQVCSTKEKKISKENSVKSRDGKGKNFFCFVDILSLRICGYLFCYFSF